MSGSSPRVSRANCATVCKIAIGLVLATARAGDGLPAVPEHRGPAADSASDSLCVRGSRRDAEGRIPPTSKWRRSLDRREAPSNFIFIAFIN